MILLHKYKFADIIHNWIKHQTFIMLRDVAT